MVQFRLIQLLFITKRLNYTVVVATDNDHPPYFHLFYPSVRGYISLQIMGLIPARFLSARGALFSLQHLNSPPSIRERQQNPTERVAMPFTINVIDKLVRSAIKIR